MLASINCNFLGTHNLAASLSSAARPMLAGAVREPKAIPVDVRVRLAHDEALVPAKAVPNSVSTQGSRPIGTLLDCYM